MNMIKELACITHYSAQQVRSKTFFYQVNKINRIFYEHSVVFTLLLIVIHICTHLLIMNYRDPVNFHAFPNNQNYMKPQ